ncbi:MAG: SCO family protein [Acidobacteriota bacterium]
MVALIGWLVVTSASAQRDPAQHDDHAHHSQAAAGTSYSRVVEAYEPPPVTLVDRSGEAVLFSEAVRHDGPLLLQFIFTTCPAVCPVLSGTFAAARDGLPPEVRMVSISIDPEQDTPARLRDYADRFRAGTDWRFLTGSRHDVVRVQKAFAAYRSNKMQHQPLTFLRPAAAAHWVRLDGFLSAADLVVEVEKASKVSLEPGRG